MKREIEKIKTTEFDLLIIGGGIHGATIAHEASLSGLKTCLIEKDDFGSQTSANSLKVLHGGLRYLQHANFKRMRESIKSRKIFQNIAPHLVKNIPFLIPTKGYGIKGKVALFVAMKLNDLISLDRNKGIDKECYIPGGTTISRDQFKKIVPHLNDRKITGGAVWYESLAVNTERLLLEFLHRAYENNVSLANYLKAEKYIYNGCEINSVRVFDKLSNSRFEIKAKNIVNAVGPWLNEILSGTEDLKFLKSPLTKAVNIIVKGNLFNDYAVGLESINEFKDKAAFINKGKRLFFFVPLQNHTMIGTTYKAYNDLPEKCNITEYDIVEILNEVNNAHKNLNLKVEDVTNAHVGLQAMPSSEIENEFDIQPETHSLIFNHSNEGNISNLVSIKSVKYTTAPSIAEDVVKTIKLKMKNKVNLNLKVIPDAQLSMKKFFDDNENFEKQTLERLWKTYGNNAGKVINYIQKDEKSKRIIFEKEKICMGEIKYCIVEEMASTSQDIIDRRLGLSALEKVSDEYYSKLDELLLSK